MLIGDEREQAMAMMLLFDEIHTGKVMVQFIRDGRPGMPTGQTIEGFRLAIQAMRAAYGITENEMEVFTAMLIEKGTRKH